MNILKYIKNLIQDFWYKPSWGPSFCIETRYGRFNYGGNCKIPGKMVADSNEYMSEKNLLTYLQKAGLRAKYELDDERFPKTLQIVCPEGGKNFYPNKGGDLIFMIRPTTSESGNPILSIDFEIKKDEKAVVLKPEAGQNESNFSRP